MPRAPVIEVTKSDVAALAVEQAAEVLRHGGLVVIPTETVYGVAVSAFSEAGLARLVEAKQRASKKPFTAHLPSADAVHQFVPALPALGKKLVLKAWPGPLTLVVPVENGVATQVAEHMPAHFRRMLFYQDTIGLRCPDHPVTGALLSQVGQPVVASSANLGGAPPATDAETAVEALGDQVDLVLDCGPARYAKPSTVVQLGDEGYEVLREGVFDSRMIRNMLRTTILFLCSGNTCRSPMAQGIARRLLSERLGVAPPDLASRGYHVISAGTHAMGGTSASPEAVHAAANLGAQIDQHQSQPLTIELLRQSDHIYAMSRGHLETVGMLLPSALSRAELLDPRGNIEDPVGSGQAVYYQVAERIEQVIQHRLSEVIS